MVRSYFLVAALGAALSVPAYAESPVFKTEATGNPKVQSVEAIRFAPGGVLLIGDGRGAQVVAVETGDLKARPWTQGKIEKIDEQLAGRLGTTAKGIEVLDLAVNPESGTAYFAVRKQDDKRPVVLTVDGAGKVGEFVLEDVKYARVGLPAGEKAPVSKVTDVAWAGDRILVAGRANEEFASKIFTIPVPLEHEVKASVYSSETYHVS